MLHSIRNSIITAVMIFIIAAVTHAQIIQDVKKTELDNGLTLLTLKDPAAPLVGVQIFYKTGNLNEPPGQIGINQICARIMASGTELCSDKDYHRLVSSLGGSNDFDSPGDYVSFSVSIPSRMLDTILALEADRMQNIKVTYENLQMAKDDLQKSRDKWFKQDMYAYLNTEIMALTFRYHPYRNPFLGLESDVEKLTIKDVKNFLSLYFQPSNVVIVIVGDIDEEQVSKTVTDRFGKILSREIPALRYTAEPKQIGERLSFIYKDVGIPAFISSYHITSVKDDDFLPLLLASEIMANGESSRFYRRLVNRENISMAIGGGAMIGSDPGIFYLWSVLNYDADVSEAIGYFEEEIENISENGITNTELERAKNRLEVEYYKSLDTFLKKSYMIGQYYLMVGNWDYINDYIKRVRALTAADITRVVATYLKVSNRSTVVLQPIEDSEEFDEKD